MACASCEYYNDKERWGSKGYCSWYKQYVYSDETCSHYKKRGGSPSGCFLTSACCSYKGFPDDCHELTTLRKYRDNYLKSLPDGQALIEEYYSIAPTIVSAIEKQDNKEVIYKEIYAVISECVKLIEADKLDETLCVYKKMVADLSGVYLKS